MAAVPETLQDLAVQVAALYAAAKTEAQESVAAANTSLSAARERVRAGGESLAAKNQEIAAKRAELADAEVPTEAAALVEELADLQAEARALQAALLDDADAVARGEAEVKAASGFLDRVSAALSEAQAELVREAVEGPRRQELRDAVADPPLDTLAADAAAAKGAGTEFDDAKKRVTDEIPADLLTAARKGVEVEDLRRSQQAASLEAVEDLLLAELEGKGGLDEKAAALQLRFARADAALRAWVKQGPGRLTQALVQAAAVNAGTSLLTDAEEAEVAARETAGAAAVPKRTAREDARKDVIEAEVGLGDALTTALAPDPTADVSAAPAVDTAEQALSDARTAFTDAQGEYVEFADGSAPPTFAEDFTAFSSALPESVWRRVVGFLEAEATLTELGGVDGDTLATDHADAEKALAAALWDAERHALTVAFLEEQVALREALAARADAARGARMLAAVRGDA
jgi:hypothetical protein